MGRYGRYDGADDVAFWRDLSVAFQHPDYQDVAPTDALADLYERRESTIEHTELPTEP